MCESMPQKKPLDKGMEQPEFLCHPSNGTLVNGDLENKTTDNAAIEYDVITDNLRLNVVYRGLDTGWSWVVLGATFMSFLVLGGSVYTTGVVHAILLERFEESNATTAWVASLFSALSSLAGPFSSFLIDRYSCRAAVMISGILLALGFVGTAFAPTIHVAIVTFGLIAANSNSTFSLLGDHKARMCQRDRMYSAETQQKFSLGTGIKKISADPMAEIQYFAYRKGLGVGSGYIAIFTTPGFNFHRKLNMAMGLANSGVGVGIFLVGPMMEIAREYYGSSGCFFILAAFALHIVVFGALMRPSALELETHRMRRVRTQKHRSYSFAPVLTYLKMWTKKCVICLSFSLFFYSIGSFAIFIHLPNFCIHNGFTLLQASFLISIVGIMTLICKLLTGVAANADEIDEIMIYAGSMWIQSFATFLLPLYGRWYAGLVIYATIIGLYFGSCYVVLPPINKKAVGVENMASALGVEYFLGGIGSIIGPVFAGHILDRAGSYELVFTISAVFLLLGALLGIVTVVFTSSLKYHSVSKVEENTVDTNKS